MTKPNSTPTETVLGDKGLELLMREVLAGLDDYVTEIALTRNSDCCAGPAWIEAPGDEEQRD